MSTTHSAIGIDFGSSRFVVGVAKRGGVEIMVNEASYRQTPCLVTFGSERRVGDRALAHVKKELKNAVFFPGRFLGDIGTACLQREEPFSYARVKLREDGRAQFQVGYEGEQVTIMPEQAVGALFTEALDVLAMNEIDNKEAVVSVPSYFNQVQRQAIIDAAKIAGVEVTKLYNESSATVMNYGIFRKADLSIDKPRTVAFVDFGHSKTAVYVANIWNDRAEVLFEETHPHLGVRNIDLALLLFYTQKFQQKHKIDLTDNPKAVYRMMEAIERQRKILTANIEATLSVECIYEDIDFNYIMQREEFEQIAATSLVTLEDVIKRVAVWLAQNKSEFALHSVERIGGGTRIPYVDTLLQRCFDVKSISKTLDANESVARGCAIQAAILSPLFKVAAFKVTDKIAYPIAIKLQYEGEQVKTKTLFDCGAEFNKTLSVSINKPVRLSVGLFVPPAAHSEPERQIVDAFIEGATSKESKFESKVTFFLNKNGIAVLEKAEMRENYITEEKIPVKKPAPTATNNTGTAPNEEKAPTEQTDGGKMNIEEPREEEFTVEKKERVRTTNIPFQCNLLYGLSPEQVKSMAHFENLIIQKEKVMKETQRAKYLLESFIYNTRNKVNEQANAKFTVPAEKQDILRFLQEAESWLYSEGVSCDKQTYEKNLAKLQEASKSFYSRFKKMEELGVYHAEALPAFEQYEAKNSELLVHGTAAQLNEVGQKIRESLGLLKELAGLLHNFSIPAVDQFDLEGRKTVVSKNYEQMNSILSSIKRDKETREREEKKRQEDEKRKQEEDAKKQKEASNKPNNGKMEVEEPSSVLEEEKKA